MTSLLARLTTALLVGLTALVAVGTTTPASAAPRTQVLKVVKVVSGELVRVRAGNGRPFLIHQAGVAVPENTCRSRAAKRALAKTLKPGTKVAALLPGGVPGMDGAGHRQAFLAIEVDGQVGSVGLAQIAAGYAWAASGYDYPYKKRYMKVAAAAKKAGVGYHGSC